MPSFLVMLLVYIYVALASYNTGGYLTLPLSSIEIIIDNADNAANVATVDSKGRMRNNHRKKEHTSREVKDWKDIWSHGTGAVMDIPLGGVCEVYPGRFV